MQRKNNLLSSLWILFTLCTLLLTVLTYFLVSNKPPKISAYDVLKKEILAENQDSELSILESDYPDSKEPDKIAAHYEELAAAWSKKGYRKVAADYLRQAADALPSEQKYLAAGNLFSELYPLETEDEQLRVNLVFGAIYSFQKALEFNKDNLNAEVKLASCYVDGTSETMKGIQMLLGVLEKDPNNVQANMVLGTNGLVSGQYQKSKIRFERVLQKDSLNLQAYYLLTESYLGLGDKDGAVSILEKAYSLIQDTLVRKEIETAILELKK